MNRITFSIRLEVGIAEERHLEDIEEQRLVDTGTGLERLGIAGDILVLPGEERLGNLVLPEGVRLGSLVPLDKQGVVRDRHLVGIVLQGMAELGDNLLALPKGIAACRAEAAVEDNRLGNLEEDIGVVIIMDSQILQLRLEQPLYILEVGAWDISELQRLEQLQWELFMLHQL